MGIREDLERSYAEHDTASCAGGMFHCIYSEEYVDSLDIQGVDREVFVLRHIAREREVSVGTVLNWIRTRDGDHIDGPLVCATYEPLDVYTVRLRLRDGNG